MSKTLTDIEAIQDRLELMAARTEWEGEILEDTVGWLDHNPHPEKIDVLFLQVAPVFARYFADPDWRADHEDWHYWTPQIVTGQFDLEKLPKGPIRDTAKSLYYDEE